MTTLTRTEEYRAAAEEYARRVVAELGSEVDSIVLFGSVARGEPGPESDIDVLVVAPKTEKIKNALNQIEYDIHGESNYALPLYDLHMDAEHLELLANQRAPLIKNMIREGVILHDNGVFSRMSERREIVNERTSTEYVAFQMELAEEALSDARFTFADGRLRVSAGRAYYAMFHAATAALLSIGVETHTHSGAIGMFGARFGLTGRVSRRLTSLMNAAFELRQDSDYARRAEIEEDEVALMVEGAAEIIEAVWRVLE